MAVPVSPVTSRASSWSRRRSQWLPSPANQFPYGPWCPSSSQACLFDANTDSNSYKYVVHLVNLSDSQPLSVDPVIENGK